MSHATMIAELLTYVLTTLVRGVASAVAGLLLILTSFVMLLACPAILAVELLSLGWVLSSVMGTLFLLAILVMLVACPAFLAVEFMAQLL